MGRETSLKARDDRWPQGGEAKPRGVEGRSEEQRNAQPYVHSRFHLAVFALFIELKLQPVGLDRV